MFKNFCCHLRKHENVSITLFSTSVSPFRYMLDINLTSQTSSEVAKKGATNIFKANSVYHEIMINFKDKN